MSEAAAGIKVGEVIWSIRDDSHSSPEMDIRVKVEECFFDASLPLRRFVEIFDKPLKPGTFVRITLVSLPERLAISDVRPLR